MSAREEVLARLRALTRRAVGPRPVRHEIADLVVDPAARRAWRAGVDLDLTQKEFALLARRRGETLSRHYLEEKLWDFAFTGTSNVVDSLVRRLRAKVDRPGQVPLVETVRGAGYRLVAD